MGKADVRLASALKRIAGGDATKASGPLRVSLAIAGAPPQPRKKRAKRGAAHAADPLGVLAAYLTYCGGDGPALVDGMEVHDYSVDGVTSRPLYVAASGTESLSSRPLSFLSLL